MYWPFPYVPCFSVWAMLGPQRQEERREKEVKLEAGNTMGKVPKKLTQCRGHLCTWMGRPGSRTLTLRPTLPDPETNIYHFLTLWGDTSGLSSLPCKNLFDNQGRNSFKSYSEQEHNLARLRPAKGMPPQLLSPGTPLFHLSGGSAQCQHVLRHVNKGTACTAKSHGRIDGLVPCV